MSILRSSASKKQQKKTGLSQSALQQIWAKRSSQDIGFLWAVFFPSVLIAVICWVIMYYCPELKSVCLVCLVWGVETNNVFTYLLFGNSCRGSKSGQPCPTTKWTVAKQNPALVGLTQVGLIVSLGFSESWVMDHKSQVMSGVLIFALDRKSRDVAIYCMLQK